MAGKKKDKGAPRGTDQQNALGSTGTTGTGGTGTGGTGTGDTGTGGTQTPPPRQPQPPPLIGRQRANAIVPPTPPPSTPPSGGPPDYPPPPPPTGDTGGPSNDPPPQTPPIPPPTVPSVLPCQAKATLRIKVTDFDLPKRLVPRLEILVTGPSGPKNGVSLDNGEVTFANLDPGAYTAKITVGKDDIELFKIESPGDTLTQTLAGGDDKLLEFKVSLWIRIYLKLQFLDPDINASPRERAFPKGMKLKFVFEGDSKVDGVVGDEGRVLDAPDGKKYIEVKRAKKWFTLDFKQPKRSFVVGEEWKADAPIALTLTEDDDPFATGSALKDKKDKGNRFFMLPDEAWDLINSDWEQKQAPTFSQKTAKFEKLDILSTRVGDEDTPAELTLDPHWQYVKFEYFDRFYGIDNHDKKPITPLPLLLEGYGKDVRAQETPALSDLTTASMWVIGPNKPKDMDLVQCIPWIIQADSAKKQLNRPWQDSMLRFRTDDDHRFLKSVEAEKREWKKLTKTDADFKPGVERLRYYDLPKEWRSSHYFCRLSDKAEDQDFFEAMVLKPTTQEKPVIFSLDDIVLTAKDLKPVTWNYKKTEEDGNPNTRVAVFINTFVGDAWDAAEPVPPTPPTPPVIPTAPTPPPSGPEKPYEGRVGRTKPDDPKKREDLSLEDKPQGPSKEQWHSPLGVYRHDRANNRPYFSRITMPSNYLADVTNWVRLIAAKGNLFDVFDQRTDFANAGTKKIVGARAGVAWVDATSTGVGVAAGSPRPAIATVKDADKHPYFSIQPYRTGEFFARDMPRPGSQRYDEWNSAVAGGTSFTGRYDIALLRCCEVEGADVERAVTLKFHRYTFDFSQPSLIAGDPDRQKAWRSDYMAWCSHRWTGGDAANSDRAWIVPRTGGLKFKAQAITFLQSYELGVATNQQAALCHFKIKVVAEAGAGGSWMNNNGEGQCRAKAGSITWDPNRGFPGAHESGHGFGMPDEYPSNEQAFGLQGYGSNHVPGAPFNLDQPNDAQAMMVYNKAVRPRYFWDITEWLRANFTELKTNYKIVHGAENNYYVPQHKQCATYPDRSFAFFPIGAYTRFSTPDPVMYDSYLMKLGKEIFTTQVLPDASDGAPVDGILTVLINVGIRFDGYLGTPGNKARREDFAARLNQRFGNALNRKVFANFDIDDGGDADGPRQFSKCYLNFALRFSDSVTIDAHVGIIPAIGAASDTQSDAASGGVTVRIIKPKVPATEPADDGEWDTAISEASRYAYFQLLRAMDLRQIASGTAKSVNDADSYKPIVKSIAPAVNPTMTRL